jgi:hypothetical protein
MSRMYPNYDYGRGVGVEPDEANVVVHKYGGDDSENACFAPRKEPGVH